ncbi:MAG: hypothetical protein WBC04_24740 [Candidatus Acidiferrales bacterium]
MVPTRYWLQLVGLVILAIAIVSNCLSALSLIPRLTGGQQSWPFHYWLRFNDVMSSYGWVGAAVGVLVWSFLIRRGYRVQKREWSARLLLLLLLLAGFAAAPLPWRPAGPTPHVHAVLQSHPGLGPGLAWGLIALVVIPLCLDAETRDSLLGHGRILSVVSLGMLLLVVAITLAGLSVISQ